MVYLHTSIQLLPKQQLIGVNATLMRLMIIFRRLQIQTAKEKYKTQAGASAVHIFV